MTESYFEWTERLFDPGQLFAKPEALEGVRVVEVAHINPRRGAEPPSDGPPGKAGPFALQRTDRACLPPT